jgi:pyrroloquinoline quinone biosynthesis protein B
MFLGHESIGSDNVPVYAMPRMVAFLESNGPWSQLTSLNNINLQELAEREPRTVAENISITPYLVPHRDEYSETVGFVVHTAGRSFLYLPDIDSWDRWEQEHGLRIERMIATIDYAFIDATFFDDNELPGRDMSGFPHPRIAAMIDRFSALPPAERAKIRFIHFNHSNPARYPGSTARHAITDAGLSVAEQGAIFCLEDQSE